MKKKIKTISFYENFWILSISVLCASFVFLNIDSATCFVLWLGYTIAVTIVVFNEEKFLQIYNKINN